MVGNSSVNWGHFKLNESSVYENEGLQQILVGGHWGSRMSTIPPLWPASGHTEKSESKDGELKSLLTRDSEEQAASWRRPWDQARLGAGYLPKNIWTFQFGNKRSQKDLEISSHRKLEWGVILFLLCIELKILSFSCLSNHSNNSMHTFKIEAKAHLDPASEWRLEGVWPRWPDSRGIALLVNPVSLLGQPSSQLVMKAKKRGWS